jgi:hypothetical protein
LHNHYSIGAIIGEVESANTPSDQGDMEFRIYTLRVEAHGIQFGVGFKRLEDVTRVVSEVVGVFLKELRLL